MAPVSRDGGRISRQEMSARGWRYSMLPRTIFTVMNQVIFEP